MKSSTEHSSINGRQTFRRARIAFLWMLLLLFAAPLACHAAQHPVDRTDYGNYVMFPVPLDANGSPVLDPNTGKPDPA